MKENYLRIRIDAPFKKELEQGAKKLNISLSAYVRMLLSVNNKKNRDAE